MNQQHGNHHRTAVRVTRRLLAPLLVGALAAAACSSGSDSAPKGPARLDPAAAAAALRALGGVAVDGSASFTHKDGTEEGTITGRVTYEPYRVHQEFPVGAGQDLANIEYRRIDADAWIKMMESAAPPFLGVPGLVIRPAGYPTPWIAITPTPRTVQDQIALPFDPAALLDAIATDDAIVLARNGESDVDGTPRARYTANFEAAQALVIGVSTLSVWIDADGVPLRIAFKATSGAAGEYDITADGSALDVTPPDAALIEPTQTIPVATADYAEIASGEADGVTYRILRAPADRNWWCWKVESEPAYEPFDELGDDGGLCVPGIETSGDPADQFALPLDSVGDGYDMLGMQVPPGSTLQMYRVDEFDAPIDVPVDANGLALYVGPSATPGVFVQLTLADGEVMLCAPGEISNYRDYVGVTPEMGKLLLSQPWNCLEKELADSLGG